MTVKVTVPDSLPSCTNLWKMQAYNGNSLNGDTFRLVNSPASMTTNITPATLSTTFSTQPTNGIAGVAIPVAVTLVSSCGVPTGTAVTLTANKDCTVANECLSGNTANTNGSGVATFTALTINTAGTGFELSTTATGFPIATSSKFSVFGEGPLQCKPGDPYQFENANAPGTTFGQPGFAEGERGAWNNYGSDCIAVGYTFTNNILSSNSVALSWNIAERCSRAPRSSTR